MSQDDDICDHPDDGSCGHVHLEDRDPCSCESASISGRAHSKKSGEVLTGHEVHAIFYILDPSDDES